MNELSLPPSTEAAIRRVEELGEALKANFPEYVFPVEHSLHGGMYARTIRMPAGTAAVGTLIRVPTLLIVSGHVRINSGDRVYELEGYHVLEGEINRKQMAWALEDTEITMIFVTKAKTVDEAEREFTVEFEQLQNRKKEISA